MISFRLCSSWITGDDVKFRDQGTHVKFFSKLNWIYSHEIRSSFQRSQRFQASKLSLCTLSILFLKKSFLEKSSASFMLCEKQFFLQSAEIRLPVLNIIKDYVKNDNKVTRKMAIPQDKVFDIINLVWTSTLYMFNSQFY